MEERAFREAVKSDPQDRLVYADWLDDHGRSDEAEVQRLTYDIGWFDVKLIEVNAEVARVQQEVIEKLGADDEVLLRIRREAYQTLRKIVEERTDTVRRIGYLKLKIARENGTDKPRSMTRRTDRRKLQKKLKRKKYACCEVCSERCEMRLAEDDRRVWTLTKTCRKCDKRYLYGADVAELADAYPG
jgi:uncharacterized protein (TIGR02996 family)